MERRPVKFDLSKTQYVQKCCESMAFSCAFFLSLLLLLYVALQFMSVENFIHRTMSYAIPEEVAAKDHAAKFAN